MRIRLEALLTEDLPQAIVGSLEGIRLLNEAKKIECSD